jgi:hypothetical protein
MGWDEPLLGSLSVGVLPALVALHAEGVLQVDAEHALLDDPA